LPPTIFLLKKLKKNNFLRIFTCMYICKQKLINSPFNVLLIDYLYLMP
jgi:hypothetical protein